MEPTLETFWETHRRKFMNLLRARGVSREDAEDVISDAYIRMTGKWHTLNKSESKKLNYCMTVVARLDLDRRRTARRRVTEVPITSIRQHSGGEGDMNLDAYDFTPDPDALRAFDSNINSEYANVLIDQIKGMILPKQAGALERNLERIYRGDEKVIVSNTDRSRLFRALCLPRAPRNQPAGHRAAQLLIQLAPRRLPTLHRPGHPARS